MGGKKAFRKERDTGGVGMYDMLHEQKRRIGLESIHKLVLGLMSFLYI